MDSINGFQSKIVVVSSLFLRSFLREIEAVFFSSLCSRICSNSVSDRQIQIQVSRSSMIIHSSGTTLLPSGRNEKYEAYDVTGHLHQPVLVDR